MVKNIYVYFIGTAGAGKSTLTAALKEWMHQSGYDAITINFDPGVQYLGYQPDIDIRDEIKLHEVMEEYNLGPNGAQIAAADLLALKSGEVADLIEKFETDYVLLDTPGQIELFSFRKSSVRVIDRFDRSRSIIVYLFDPFVAVTASGFISQLLLSVTIALRFNLPMIRVLNKSDLVEQSQIEQIVKWSADPEALYASLCDEVDNPHAVFNLNLFRALEDIGLFNPIIPVAGVDFETMYPIYFNIQQIFAGGEDIER